MCTACARDEGIHPLVVGFFYHLTNEADMKIWQGEIIFHSERTLQTNSGSGMGIRWGVEGEEGSGGFVVCLPLSFNLKSMTENSLERCSSGQG